MSNPRLVLGLKVCAQNAKWIAIKLKTVVSLKDKNNDVEYNLIVNSLSKELISLANDKERLKNLIQSFLPEQLEQWKKNYLDFVLEEENK